MWEYKILLLAEITKLETRKITLVYPQEDTLVVDDGKRLVYLKRSLAKVTVVSEAKMSTEESERPFRLSRREIRELMRNFGG